jgi:uncharacterized membrane protein YdbT with pleckstrin-like domain
MCAGLSFIAGFVLASVIYLTWPEGALAMLASGIACVAGIAGFVAVMVPVWTTEIAVTNQRLVVKKGLFTRSSEELQLWSIEEVDWEQGLLDRFFGFGRLIICGTGDEDMRLPLISDALAFRKAVQQAISEVRPRQPAGAADEGR